jgi:hypothetical protein
METFSHRGKDIEFWCVTGEVLGSNKYSETYVSSSGGGGYVGGYVGPHGGNVSGHVSSPTIHSSTVTNHEFWIKTEDGLEKDIKLVDIDIPLRAGQKITLILAGRKGEDNAWYSILVNHSAGKHWFIKSPEELNEKLKLEVMTGKSLLMSGVIAWGVAYMTASDRNQLNNSGSWEHVKDWNNASWELALGLVAVFLIYRLVVKQSRLSCI